MIDSHCHLDHEHIHSCIIDIIDRSKKVGLTKLLTICTNIESFENIKNIDQSLILWRSTIQWIGGLYFLFSIIYLIDIYD